MDTVLSTTKFVVDNSRQVKIKKEEIKDFCENFSESHINYWLNEAPLDFRKLNGKERFGLILVFNALSFSYWGKPKWAVEYKGENFDGSFGMIAAIARAIENKNRFLILIT